MECRERVRFRERILGLSALATYLDVTPSATSRWYARGWIQPVKHEQGRPMFDLYSVLAVLQQMRLPRKKSLT